MLTIIALMFSAFTAVAEPIQGGVQDSPCRLPIPEDQILTLDFGRFCKYEIANAALRPATDHRVIYFGDSITEGWLNRVRGISHDDVLNRGVGGQTTAQMLVRFRADVLNLKPKIVHIMAGTNDIAGNTGPTSLKRMQEAFMSMVEQAKARGIRVILASITPAKLYPWNTRVNPVPSIRAMNRWLRDYAAQEGLVYADYYTPLHDGRDGFSAHLTFDGIHPNAAGYAVMETVAVDAIQRANR